MVPTVPYGWTLCYHHLIQMLRRGNHSPIKSETMYAETRNWFHAMILADDLPDEPELSPAARRYYECDGESS